MGCHTWFSVPYKTDKKEIIELAQKWLDKTDYISPGHRKMYQWVIDNEIEEPICELASFETDCNRQSDWTLYKDIYDYTLEKYNRENKVNIQKYSEEAIKLTDIESYSDEPRIGGYPNKVIHSYDEMIDFMKVGYTNEEGEHYEFYIDENRKKMVMNGIKQFFINHPNGIITFG